MGSRWGSRRGSRRVLRGGTSAGGGRKESAGHLTGMPGDPYFGWAVRDPHVGDPHIGDLSSAASCLASSAGSTRSVSAPSSHQPHQPSTEISCNGPWGCGGRSGGGGRGGLTCGRAPCRKRLIWETAPRPHFPPEARSPSRFPPDARSPSLPARSRLALVAHPVPPNPQRSRCHAVSRS